MREFIKQQRLFIHSRNGS